MTSILEDGGCSSGNTLYLNQGANTFAETSVPAGVNDGGWGWGAVPTDLDLDGDEDIVENNGWFLTLSDEAEPLCAHDPVPQWLNEPASFKGGVLVPSVNVVLPGLSTNGAGGLLLLAPWPTGLPPQLPLFVQIWVADPGAVHGVAGSNAVQLTTP